MELTVIDCVTLRQVPESQSEIIANLMQLYKHDFSEFAKVGSRYGEVGPDGRYTYEGLDSYWRADDRFALTVQADGGLAGFILVNGWRRSTDRSTIPSASSLFFENTVG
jgi:predicted acetyltransferase